MASTSPQAACVCLRCRRRKKACDKILPRCSYCKSRNLDCRYIESPPLATKPLAKVGISHTYPTVSLLTLPGLNVRASISDQVQQVLLRLSLQQGSNNGELSRPYWQGLHRWLPFLSLEMFDRRMVHFLATQSAEFGVMLLSMILIGRTPPTSADAIDQHSLYLAAKTLLSQLQSCDIGSVDSIKSAILLAVYEYSIQKGDVAFVTLATAIRTAYAIGLDREPTTDQLASEEQHELNNLWWMLVICERYVEAEPLSRRCNMLG
ncbi:hypothetical protein K431DRAFT_280305 [Polychaeton citri CBS 116435]|uniref:Zn(2)-C6 fungal-type domain-containing protein n=1 Tax=Polychaeton citri CBS 116435 TaxID=1314669 RepID=A0A9P4QHA8_9PEZI|nr:hypothetical protein K431DRAFT_280305 [Polychaeton citri CBS 116435]